MIDPNQYIPDLTERYPSDREDGQYSEERYIPSYSPEDELRDEEARHDL